MVLMEEDFNSLKVVKRNGKKVDFSLVKVSLAIKKRFDSVTTVD